MFGQYSKSFQFRINELCRKSSRSYDYMTKHGWLNSGKVRNYKRIRFKVSFKIEVYQGDWASRGESLMQSDIDY